MSIRVHGATPTPIRPEPEPEQPEPSATMTVDEAAKVLGIHRDSVCKGIREDEAHGTHRIPGGYRIGGRYYVLRAVFERAVRDGVLPDRPTAAPAGLTPAMLADALQIVADQLRQKSA